MFGLEFDGARDRAAKRPGSKSLVKPPSPPCEATRQGGRGAASEKATYWYFPGRRQTPTEAGSGHHALLEGSAHFPLHRHRRLAHTRWANCNIQVLMNC